MVCRLIFVTMRIPIIPKINFYSGTSVEVEVKTEGRESLRLILDDFELDDGFNFTIQRDLNIVESKTIGGGDVLEEMGIGVYTINVSGILVNTEDVLYPPLEKMEKLNDLQEAGEPMSVTSTVLSTLNITRVVLQNLTFGNIRNNSVPFSFTLKEVTEQNLEIEL